MARGLEKPQSTFLTSLFIFLPRVFVSLWFFCKCLWSKRFETWGPLSMCKFNRNYDSCLKKVINFPTKHYLYCCFFFYCHSQKPDIVSISLNSTFTLTCYMLRFNVQTGKARNYCNRAWSSLIIWTELWRGKSWQRRISNITHPAGLWDSVAWR